MYFTLRLACARYKDSLCAEETLEEARRLDASELGLGKVNPPVVGQSFYLDLIAGLPKHAGDPDWVFFPGLADGVELGVGVRCRVLPGYLKRKRIGA